MQYDYDNLPIVLVTGASGFVALHCVRRLLEGPYKVRGTVRDKNNAQKIQPLLRLPYAKEKLELVEADLLIADNWNEVVHGCTYILHVASPWIITASSSIVQTAVQGTLNVLNAASINTSVKKVVLTSSCAAVNDGHKNNEGIFDERSWSDLNSSRIEWYGISKTLAERTAWDFWHTLPESSRFELTVLNPTLVFGPVLSDIDHGCAQILSRMMKRSTNLAQPKVSLGLVDVRDVAEAHVRSLERSNTNGERILITASPSAWYSDIAKWLKEEFGQFDYGINTWEVPTWILKIYAASGIDPQSKAVVRRRGPELRFDNSKSIRLLGMEYRPVDKSVKEMMYSMIDMNMVKSTKKYDCYKKLRKNTVSL